MSDNTQSGNRCKRCNRELSNSSAEYGGRCARLLGISTALTSSKDKSIKAQTKDMEPLEKDILQGFELGEKEELLRKKSEKKPNIRVVKVDGDTVWVDISSFQGIAILPNGELLHGNETSNSYKELAKLIKKRDESEYDPHLNREIDNLANKIADHINFKKFWKSKSESERERKEFIDNITSSEFYKIFNAENAMANEIAETTEIANSMWRYPSTAGFIEFFFFVRNGSVVDLKNREPYKNHSAFILEGEIVDRDALGNILYGYLGMHLNFPEETLLWGAGMAQRMAGTSDPQWYDSYYDDPRDQARIKQGIRYYHLKNPEPKNRYEEHPVPKILEDDTFQYKRDDAFQYKRTVMPKRNSQALW